MSKRLTKIFSYAVAALTSAVALASVVAGCSDNPAAATCYDYSTFSATSRTVGFKADVLPILQTSCSISGTCHGTVTGSVGVIFLGPAKGVMPTQMDLDAIIAQTVAVNATKAPTMKIVEANKPEASFLMHKMDSTLTCADVTCPAGCGSPMPLANAELGEMERETVRLWIAQGAKND